MARVEASHFLDVESLSASLKLIEERIQTELQEVERLKAEIPIREERVRKLQDAAAAYKIMHDQLPVLTELGVFAPPAPKAQARVVDHTKSEAGRKAWETRRQSGDNLFTRASERSEFMLGLLRQHGPLPSRDLYAKTIDRYKDVTEGALYQQTRALLEQKKIVRVKTADKNYYWLGGQDVPQSFRSQHHNFQIQR